MGSVFSPYYHWSGRQDPENHVCINVALYGPQQHLWSMTERGRKALSRDPTRFVVGPSALSWDGSGLTVEIDAVTAPLPRRLKGKVRLVPEAMTDALTALDAASRHHWRPIAPAARVEMAFSDPDLAWSGHGYLDMNYGDEPLEAAFRRWDWSRAMLPDGAAILYDMERRDGTARSLGFRIGRDGRVADFEPPARQDLPMGFWRVRRATRAEEGGARLVRKLEDAPFYARAELETHLLGERVPAVHESLDLDRLRLPVVRAMLPFRMPRIWW